MYAAPLFMFIILNFQAKSLFSLLAHKVHFFENLPEKIFRL